MIHYSCDRCNQKIASQDEFRYVVRMEVRAALDLGTGLDNEADRDPLMELHEILESAEDAESDLVDEDVYQQLRYDLCPECYRKLMRNPVGREQSVEFNFSKN